MEQQILQGEHNQDESADIVAGKWFYHFDHHTVVIVPLMSFFLNYVKVTDIHFAAFNNQIQSVFLHSFLF